jgi:phosphocarrier protein HPr
MDAPMTDDDNKLNASVKVVIRNRLGMHARPAMTFVDLAGTFESKIQVQKAEKIVDGKSIMQMMVLAATQNTELEIHAQGSDAVLAIEKLKALVDRHFDEDD